MSGWQDIFQKRPWLPSLLWLTILATLLTCLYHPVLDFDFSGTDDVELIVDDWEFLSDPANILELPKRTFFSKRGNYMTYYRPLVTLSFMVDAILSDKDPYGYHLTNLLLHILVVFGFYWVLLTILNFSFPLAAFGSAIFAFHPVMTHAIAWIPGRSDILLTLFLLGSFISFSAYTKNPTPIRLIGHGILTLFAMLCKESGVLAPMLLWIFYGMKKKPDWRGNKRHLAIVHGLIGALWWINWTLATQENMVGTVDDRKLEFLTHLPALMANLGKLMFPWHLSTLATYDGLSVILGILALIPVGLAVRRTEEKRLPLSLAAGLCFIAFSLPTLFVADQLVLENRLYGLLPVLVVIGLAFLESNGTKLGPRVIFGLGILVVGASVGRVIAYLPAFSDEKSFLIHATENSPNSSLAHQNYGAYLYRNKNYADAERYLAKAIELDPKASLASYNLGNVYRLTGRVQLAYEAYKREIKVNPTHIKARINVAMMTNKYLSKDKALEILRAAQLIAPHDQRILSRIEGIENGTYPSARTPTGELVP